MFIVFETWCAQQNVLCFCRLDGYAVFKYAGKKMRKMLLFDSDNLVMRCLHSSSLLFVDCLGSNSSLKNQFML